jgi:hypothetical protein
VTVGCRQSTQVSKGAVVVRRSTTQVEAREQARARLAQRHAATRAREKANEDDLIAFLALDADVEDAAVTRDVAITAAHTAYDTAIATTRTAQAEKVAAMLARGESAADVADLTGWTLKQVRASTTTTPTPTPLDAAGDATTADEQAS